MRRCQAVTLASTYSAAHRCLKAGAKVPGGRRLCTHHRIMEDSRRRAAK